MLLTEHQTYDLLQAYITTRDQLDALWQHNYLTNQITYDHLLKELPEPSCKITIYYVYLDHAEKERFAQGSFEDLMDILRDYGFPGMII